MGIFADAAKRDHAAEDRQEKMPATLTLAWQIAAQNERIFALEADRAALLEALERTTERLEAWADGEQAAQISAERRRDRPAAEGHYHTIHNYRCLTQMNRAAIARCEGQK